MIDVIAAILAGGFVGFLLEVILFYIFDNWENIDVERKIHKMIAYFLGLGGTSTMGAYFLAIKVFPYFIIGLVGMFLFWGIPSFIHLKRKRG